MTAMKDNTTRTPEEILSQIAMGKLHCSFGEPFFGAFKAAYSNGDESVIRPAALICSLFLSTILEGFPSDRLNTFVRYTRDHCSSFIFDCRKYDEIYALMKPEMLGSVALIDKDGKTRFKECSKQEILEAFDFYTNR